jgi:RNA polymerase sigma-70 factor (ECF subfamily)
VARAEPAGDALRITHQMTVSDATLIGRLASDPTGDGLRTLYRRYAGELYGFALNSLRDRGLAEEVVQDAFTSVWRHADTFDPELGSFRTWLYGLARNRIVDMRRRAAVRPTLTDAEPRDEPGEVDRSLEEAMLRWQVAAALAHLSPAHREVVRLAHFQALSLREIAEALGLPLGTVKSRTYYALRHLRLVLDEMEVGR